MPSASATLITPIWTVMRAPYMMRLSMSRPTSSVPKGNSDEAAPSAAHAQLERIVRRDERGECGEKQQQDDRAADLGLRGAEEPLQQSERPTGSRRAAGSGRQRRAVTNS